jgi:hypothetical protein
MKTVKVNVLRNVQHGSLYLTKGSKSVECPEDLARELAKGPRPAVEIVKEKA